MFFPKINVKDDPVRRWHRPDRHFFANGACQVLAFAFLERYPDMGFHAGWIKPATGFTDYHGLTTERRLLAFGFMLPGDSFPAGMLRSRICRPMCWFQNNAPDRSRASGCANPDSSFTTQCHGRMPSLTGSAITGAGSPRQRRMRTR
jgi:hypothetical protein